jgi:hypothetical protein
MLNFNIIPKNNWNFSEEEYETDLLITDNDDADSRD